MTKTMQAVEITQPGGPDVLRMTTRPVPTIAADDVLVRVAAAGVNRPDVAQRSGVYPPPPGASDIPGLEIAGRIEQVGGAVSGWKVGDEVCALVTGGGYAEYCAVPAGQCLPVPKGLSLIEAASLPETFFTVWSNVFDRGRLTAGETLLIQGGSSGIGVTAIQMAKALGSRVITTAGSDDKCRACQDFGADVTINYKTQDFVKVVKQATEGKGADVILDMVGGDYLKREIACVALEGRIVLIAFLGGSQAPIDIMPLMLKRAWITGSTLRARPVAFKAAIATTLRAKIWPLIEAGRIKSAVHQVFTLEEAAEAHALMETSTHIGKIVLTVP
ncbi:MULTISPECIES: NAD(P)H-quinone oxidoreductase [unclassified Beijerinckia]|uniref:NAD(P)H-quinone oxidoreductase n=1 Tax=unclassified Beijerinckia TaxID=2638183 RepID=UPI000896D3D2|nr:MULTISPECIES: NAD(P)H-quinone oxidoreductase [unclassified Beijerinckia]MDH7798918.1 NADPH2:quinone reductase [Beijerinckia sp. GAS462]SED87026.1 NADPH2:quinone reductase [Beijerinckia sp. 28-YEA-48]